MTKLIFKTIAVVCLTVFLMSNSPRAVSQVPLLVPAGPELPRLKVKDTPEQSKKIPTSSTSQTANKTLDTQLDYIPNHLLVQFKEAQFTLPQLGYERYSIHKIKFINPQTKSLLISHGVEYISRTFDIELTLQQAVKVYSPRDYSLLKNGIKTHLQHRYLLILNNADDLMALERSLLTSKLVKNVSYDHFLKNRTEPDDQDPPLTNDTFISFQYNLHEINIEPVWSQGIVRADQTIVAILDDSNFDIDFPEYAPNISGYAHAFSGDLIEPCVVNDDHHGNLTLSIMGAVGNNEQGISGVFHQGKIHAWNVGQLYNGQCAFPHSLHEQGMAKAVSNGARIINRSYWIGDELDWSDPLSPALPQTLIVNAAGNENCNLDNQEGLVDFANLPHALFVGGSNVDGNIWRENPRCDGNFENSNNGILHGSNYGDIVEVYTPSEEVSFTIPTFPNRRYFASGTSLAAPQVSGALSLAWSICPGLSAAEMKDILVQHGTRDSGLPILDVEGLVNQVLNIKNGPISNNNNLPNGDRDGDRIINVCDNCPNRANRNQANDDGDAYGDVCDPEPDTAGRFVENPLDRDDDGILNDEDNCPDAYNIEQLDIDFDGVGEACDNCPGTPNYNQGDLDGDGLGNMCDGDADNDQSGNNPDIIDDSAIDPDDDNDGILDIHDNCRRDPNPDQLNTDRDQFGDVCDNDIDNDRISNHRDNCTHVSNFNQNDLDQDGNGDACDPDDDNDGVGDVDDNCPVAMNVDQEDLDQDRLGDACDPDDDDDLTPDELDNCPRIINPAQEDLDGDGTGDACDEDLDNDGIGNGDDNCPFIPNPGQDNLDEDESGDACDEDPDGDGRFAGSINGDDCNENDPDRYERVPVFPDGDRDNVPNEVLPHSIPCCDGTEAVCIGNEALTLNGNNVFADNCPDDANPDQEDFDGDGEGDICDNDNDNDLIPDESDNCPLLANQDQSNLDGDNEGDACDSDRDGDNIPNQEDNCPSINNPDQLDDDNNGIGNECEDLSDIDEDGIDNEEDNCPEIPNPDQLNEDNDPYGDACDLCPDYPHEDNRDQDDDGTGDVCDYDRDNDGFDDEDDNCPNLHNPEQSDLDDDNMGDECDPDDDGDGILDRDDNCPRLFNPRSQDTENLVCGGPYPDYDHDLIVNRVDNCALNRNPDQLDSDSDLVGDVCDNCPNIPNPFSQYNNLNCESDDRDGDGFPNDEDACPNHPEPEENRRHGFQDAIFYADEGRWVGRVCEPELYELAEFDNFRNGFGF